MRSDVARMARRLAGRSVGVVLSGGGARAFAHLGVLEVLLDAGMLVDRVGGVSMGAFIGGLLAADHDSAVDRRHLLRGVGHGATRSTTTPSRARR